MPEGLELRRVFARWWREQRDELSIPAVLKRMLALAWDFLRDSFPDRRRQRYGDAEYDWEHRVDTTSATLNWRTRLLGVFNSPYQPVPSEEFREMMAALSIDFPRFTFIDIGSGKGRALLLAMEFAFRRIIGIELLPELNEIAMQNVRRFNSRGESRNCELLCQDVADFEFPAEPAVVFLFNPLPVKSLKKVLRRLEESLRISPREIYIAYANPVFDETVAISRTWARIAHTSTYSLYRSQSEC